MKAAFHTLGCKVNQYETEAIKEQFKGAGYEIGAEEDPADVYIINTCTVTNLADRKSRQYIRRMKKQNPEAIVVVTGCYAQVNPEEVASLPEVDIVTGTGEKGRIIEYVQEFLDNKEKQKHILSYSELTGYSDEGIITSMDSRTRAYIKIQEGCDRFCSYCLIPFARGPVRSRDPKSIVSEAETLISKCFKELVLTGINTALYGREDGFSIERFEGEKKMDPMEIVIKRLNELEGEFRIRLSSLEPTVIDSDYVKKLLKYDRLCHHLHLSIQSGSDNVISAMNRNYTRSEYLDIVKELKAFDPHYGISTDIICGFPGETDEDFADSLSMVREAGFCKVHAFNFSPRKGTAAYEMDGQVSSETKNFRVSELIREGETVANEFLDGLRNEERKVIFEEVTGEIGETDGFSPEEENAGKKVLTGYTDNYVKVYAVGDLEDLNKILPVKLLEKYRDGMKGEILCQTVYFA